MWGGWHFKKKEEEAERMAVVMGRDLGLVV